MEWIPTMILTPNDADRPIDDTAVSTARALLLRAQARAEEILADAERSAERRGRDLETTLREEAAARLAVEIQSLDEFRRSLVQTLEAQAIELALRIAHHVVNKEMESSATGLAARYVRAQGFGPLSNPIRVVVHESELEEFVAISVRNGISVQVVADSALKRGELVLEYSGARVVVSPYHHLEAIGERLRSSLGSK